MGGTWAVDELVLYADDALLAINKPPGCSFHPRCPIARPACREERPELVEVEPGHFAACPYHAEM